MTEKQAGKSNGGGQPRILLVDDEKDILSVLSDILESQGFTVVAAWEGEDAVEIANLYQPDILLTDYCLPGMDGVTTIEHIRSRCPHTHVILMSGHLSNTTRKRAQQVRVDCIMEKPVHIPELLRELCAYSHPPEQPS